MYSVALVFLLAAVAGASDHPCPANDPNLQNEYERCQLIRPLYYDEHGKAYSYTDEKILINCSKTVKSTHEEVPLSGLYVNVVGYDEDANAVQQKKGYTNSNGIFTFTPLVAGDYLFQVEGFKKPSEFEIRDNPNSVQVAAEGTLTGGAVAAEEVGEPEVEKSTEETAEPENSLRPEDASADGEESEESGFLGFVVNEMEEDEPGDGVSGFVLMLVSLLIS